MKRILLIAIAILGICFAQAQEIKVIDKKPINGLAKDRIQMSFEKTSRMQKDFLRAMKVEELLSDTIQFKGKIDTMFNNLWTVHSIFEYQMSIPDTISLYKIDGKFYENEIGIGIDLLTERESIINKYNAMVIKYGELSKYESEFQKMKKRFDKINDWEKQIINN